MPRAIKTTAISFGLVSVPVKMYASRKTSARVSLNWLDSKTGTRVKQQYINPDTGQVVPREDMVKGFKVGKDQYVTLSDREVQEFNEPDTENIQIEEFVPVEQISRLWIENCYWLGAAKGGGRAYRLLSTALARSGMAAIALFSSHGKQKLMAIRSYRNGLMMEHIRYSSDIRPWDEIPDSQEEGKIDPDELILAVKMIRQKAGDFNPDQYFDSAQLRKLELIQQKIEAQEIVGPTLEPDSTQIIDLMEAIKANIAETA